MKKEDMKIGKMKTNFVKNNRKTPSVLENRGG